MANPRILFPNSGPSILNGKDRGNQKIRKDYLNDFNNNGEKKGSYFKQDYDEPTYVTFKIDFVFDDSEANTSNAYNELPQPFLTLKADTPKYTDIYDLTNYEEKMDDDGNVTRLVNGSPIGDDIYVDVDAETFERTSGYAFYSTYNYLIDQKESYRAKLLKEFIKMLRSLTKDYPYYFKSIEGINTLLKVDSGAGQRITNENNIITLKCYEGLDQRITQLLNTYKKIVWDDVYQRWVVPDMMRYFKMKIYISEIRNFHISSRFEEGTQNNLNAQKGSSLRVINTISNILSKVKGLIASFNSSGAWGLLNNELNNYMPVTCITCNMCEFVIDDMFEHFGTLNSTNKNTPLDDVGIKIRIGNIMENSVYPLGGDNGYFYNSINDIEERKPKSDKDFEKYLTLNDEILYRTKGYSSAPFDTKYDLMDRTNWNPYDANSNPEHGYYEKDASRGGLVGGLIKGVVNSAIGWGVSFADNWVNDKLNKVINSPIAGNLSFNEALNALASKDIITMYSAIRDGINKSELYKEEEKKEKSITIADAAFKSYLKEIAKLPLSEATNNEKIDAEKPVVESVKHAAMTYAENEEKTPIELKNPYEDDPRKTLSEATNEQNSRQDLLYSDQVGQPYGSIREEEYRDIDKLYNDEYNQEKNSYISNPYVDEPNQKTTDIENLYEDTSTSSATLKYTGEVYSNYSKTDVFNPEITTNRLPATINDGHDDSIVNYQDFARQYNANEGPFSTMNLSEATDPDTSLGDYKDLKADPNNLSAAGINSVKERDALLKAKEIAEQLNTTPERVVKIAQIIDDADLTTHELDLLFKAFAGMTINEPELFRAADVSPDDQRNPSRNYIDRAIENEQARFHDSVIETSFVDMLSTIRKLALSEATENNPQLESLSNIDELSEATNNTGKDQLMHSADNAEKIDILSKATDGPGALQEWDGPEDSSMVKTITEIDIPEPEVKHRDIELGIGNPDYTSKATDDSNKIEGISDIADNHTVKPDINSVDILDNGNTHAPLFNGIENPEYMSSATRPANIEGIDETEDHKKTDIQTYDIQDSDAIHGKVEKLVEDPAYVSSATTNGKIQGIDIPADREKSAINKVNIQDPQITHEKIKNLVENPEYTSSATTNGKIQGIDIPADKEKSKIGKVDIPDTDTTHNDVQKLVDNPKYASSATEGNKLKNPYDDTNKMASIIFKTLKSKNIEPLILNDRESAKKVLKDIYDKPDNLTETEHAVISALYEEVISDKSQMKDIKGIVDNVGKKLEMRLVGPIDQPELSRATTNRKIEKTDKE